MRISDWSSDVCSSDLGASSQRSKPLNMKEQTMAEITAATVKELRERSGAGMMDCKKALNETNGDLEAAVDWLRTKGLAAAAKKSSRTAAEGLVGVAVAGTKRSEENTTELQSLMSSAYAVLGL